MFELVQLNKSNYVLITQERKQDICLKISEIASLEQGRNETLITLNNREVFHIKADLHKVFTWLHENT